jgi:hypothetical protein
MDNNMLDFVFFNVRQRWTVRMIIRTVKLAMVKALHRNSIHAARDRDNAEPPNTIWESWCLCEVVRSKRVSATLQPT